MIDPNTQCGACVGGGGKKRRIRKKYAQTQYRNKTKKYAHCRTNAKKYKRRFSLRKTRNKWHGGSILFQPYRESSYEISPNSLKI